MLYNSHHKNAINNDRNIQIRHSNINWKARKKITLKKFTVTKACRKRFYRKINIKQSTPLVLFVLVTLGDQTSLLDRSNKTWKNLVLDRLLGEHLCSWQHLNPTYICPGIFFFYCLLTHHWAWYSSENLAMLPEYTNSELVARI